MRCHRCGNETLATIMSTFNTESICMPCCLKERQHPDYERACQAERAAVMRGDYNFPGIGKPADL